MARSTHSVLPVIGWVIRRISALAAARFALAARTILPATVSTSTSSSVFASHDNLLPFCWG